MRRCALAFLFWIALAATGCEKKETPQTAAGTKTSASAQTTQWEYAILSGVGTFTTSSKQFYGLLPEPMYKALGGTGTFDHSKMPLPLYDAMGANGWELVAVQGGEQIFKRPKRQ